MLCAAAAAAARLYVGTTQVEEREKLSVLHVGVWWMRSLLIILIFSFFLCVFFFFSQSAEREQLFSVLFFVPGTTLRCYTYMPHGVCPHIFLAQRWCCYYCCKSGEFTFIYIYIHACLRIYCCMFLYRFVDVVDFEVGETCVRARLRAGGGIGHARGNLRFVVREEGNACPHVAYK